MSIWKKFSVESHIRDILNDVTLHAKGHHFSRPFLTAYQIAIEFAERYPNDCKSIGKPIGGKGTGQKDSLAQYLALELSRRIKSGKLSDIEGRFLHEAYLNKLEYCSKKGTIESSVGPGADLSMFRLIDDSEP